MKSRKRWLLAALMIVMFACVVSGVVSAWSNRSLPTHSQITERLNDVEQARLEEAVHLRQEFGNEIWPGWGDMDIPIVVYNEAYAFLTGFEGQPAPGWVTVPHGRARGSAWEPVADDSVQSLPYFRQRLPDPTKTPENFIVQVGSKFAASMQTWEYAQVRFFSDFRTDMPGFLQQVIPYRLVWNVLFGATETYLSGLEHESFHAYQAATAPQRLEGAEAAVLLEDQYPWEDQESETIWKEELDLLVRAIKAETEAEAADLAREFLAQRASRRSATGLRADLVDFERQREWLEGLAKYSELTIVHTAANTPDYSPLPAMELDDGFKQYAAFETFYNQQIEEIGRMAGHSGEIRFYYSGMAQAVLLDRLMPSWKEGVFHDGVWLEDLLAEAVR